MRRIAATHKPTQGHLLTVRLSRKGYSYTDLSRHNKKVRVLVHRLVAKAFIGPPPLPRSQVNHKNGHKTDNQPTNLEWTDNSGNLKHAQLCT